MNKVATYLNEHLTGEVVTHDGALADAQRDGSVLARQPELIARVADTSDVRKILRFCSQLAEKGHVLPVYARGCGTDSTGAAIGRGIAIDMSAHMHNVVGIDAKQQLIHLQSGISHRAAQAVLSTHKGLGLPEISLTGEDGTIGGVISTEAAGILSSAYGLLSQSIHQMEVVLSSGDIVQTGRLSKRELSKKKGLATFEGELYRQLDNLITDNEALIARIDASAPEMAGFSSIAQVRQRDGSFDLTPLFVGAQGSLGIIGELIMKADFIHPELTVVSAAYSSMNAAQAAVDTALQAGASTVELIDGRLFSRAAAQGKKLAWAPKECYRGGVVVALFHAFSDRARNKAAKKLLRALRGGTAAKVELRDMEMKEAFTLHSVLTLAEHPADEHGIVPQVFSGMWLPGVQLDGFIKSMRALEKEYGVAMPLFIDATTGMINSYPVFSSKKVSDRQRILKLCSDMVRIVTSHEGSFAGFGGEGRLKAAFVQPTLTPEERDLYAKIKHIFDPKGILAPGIKTAVPMKQLAEELNAWCRLAG